MLGLRNLKGALHLLLLTVFITYTCLYTLTFLNQFQPQLLPSPLPAAPIENRRVRISPQSSLNSRSHEDTEVVNHNSKDSSNQKNINSKRTSPKVTNEYTENKLEGNDSKDEKTSGKDYVDRQETRGAEDTERIETNEEENSDRQETGGKEQTEKQETIEDEYNERQEKSEEEYTERQEESEEEFTKRPRRKKRVWPVVLEPSGGAALHEIDLSKYSSEDQEILKARLSVMDERTTLVGEICRKQPKGIHTPSGANHLVWDTEHDPNIIWCPNYKVASTSMMMSFMRLTKKRDGLKSKKFVRQGEVRKLFWSPSSAQEKAEVFKNGVRVIIVRHPFTRILSAYRDKMIKLKPGPAKFDFRSVQKKIIAQYRKENSTVDYPFPTFPEFIQYVIDETKDLTTSQDWRDSIVCWITYWARCNVCTADFNIIMKLETLAEDKEFLVSLANLTQLKKASTDEWRHLHNVTSHDVAPEYYSQLTRDQILQLYENYKLDFELFGYDIKEYLALV